MRPLITIFQIFGPSYGSVLMCLWVAKLVRQTKAQLRCPIFTQNQAKNYKNIRYSGKLCSVILSHFFSTKLVFSAQIREQMSGPKISQYEKSILGCGPLVLAGLWNKRVWADYEQLLRPVFSLFWGQKTILKFFWKHYSVRTEKLHNNFIKKNLKFFFWVRKSEKTRFF